ncbi:hypothetical protein THAOC_01906, partial [Thalassiosira oceanica]
MGVRQICFKRDGYTDIPGCTGKGTEDYDYCVPDYYSKYARPKHKEQEWSFKYECQKKKFQIQVTDDFDDRCENPGTNFRVGSTGNVEAVFPESLSWNNGQPDDAYIGSSDTCIGEGLTVKQNCDISSDVFSVGQPSSNREDSPFGRVTAHTFSSFRGTSETVVRIVPKEDYTEFAAAKSRAPLTPPDHASVHIINMPEPDSPDKFLCLKITEH